MGAAVVGALLVVLASACTSTSAPTESQQASQPSVETTAPPPPATRPPQATPTGTDAPASTAASRFDYQSIATEVATVDTAIGSITWLKGRRVPLDWVDIGFPEPGFGTLFWSADGGVHEGDTAEENAPCCLDIERVPNGWVGVGNTDWSHGDRNQFKWDNPVTLEPYHSYDEQECENLPWRFESEVWFSPDGLSWDQVTDSGFGPSGLDTCTRHALRLAAGGNTSIVVGGDGLWTSANLKDWTRSSLELPTPGTITYIDAILATGTGWLILGTRQSEPPTSPTGGALGPTPTEWVAWVSPDAITWTPLDLTAIIGDPCESLGRCAYVGAGTVENAIVVYVWDESLAVHGFPGWTLWIGLLLPPEEA